MNPRHTWIWLALAAGLFSFIVFYERGIKPPDAGPRKVLPGLVLSDIRAVQVLPRGQLAIYAARTNGEWNLTQPMHYPAEQGRIDGFLTVLSNLTATTYIPREELKNVAEEDVEYGFNEPQFSVMLGNQQQHFLIGNATAFGDQVFLKVVGNDGVFVVDGRLLQWFPKQANDWRQRAVVPWEKITFDRFVVANAGKILDLQVNPESRRWHIVSPMSTRADMVKVKVALQRLGGLVVQQFVSDDPKTDLEAFGLQTPELTLTFYRGTNELTSIDFGRSPTNAPELAYARAEGRSSIVTVPRASYEQWLASNSESFRSFFDRHLVTFTAMPDSIEVHGKDDFTLERIPNNVWRVTPQGFDADPGLMAGFLAALTNLQGAQIVKEVVTKPDLAAYALASPEVQYTLRAARTNAAGILTNTVLAQVSFGVTNQLYARRSNDEFVFTVEAASITNLPWISWQMRDRQIWKFSEDEVAGVTVHQNGKEWQIVRAGPATWKVAPGHQGVLDDVSAIAIEETVHRLGELSAAVWTRRGEPDDDEYGFKQRDYSVTVELKNGEKKQVHFGTDAPSRFPYGKVELAGETWIFEFPWLTFQNVLSYLHVPEYVH